MYQAAVLTQCHYNLHKLHGNMRSFFYNDGCTRLPFVKLMIEHKDQHLVGCKIFKGSRYGFSYAKVYCIGIVDCVIDYSHADDEMLRQL